MAERKTREEKMTEIQEKLEAGVRDIFSSEKYKEYIDTMSKFPHYSVNNCVLIASQMPSASLVCGFRKWQKDFNRTVNKGQHGIMILAPIKGKTKVEEEVFDENQKAVLDENGKQKTETVEREYQTFRPVYVFDVSQTSGAPLPTLATELDETVSDYTEIKEVLMEVSPVPVSFEKFDDAAFGYFSPTQDKIVVKEGLPELQTVKTLIHEIAHATLGHGTKEDKFDRETAEVQAESVAYWVTQLMGLDTADYSFGYISGWSKDREVSELKENLDLIKTTADKISSQIEEKLKERLAEIDTLDPELVERCKEAMEVAGYSYDSLKSGPGNIRFFTEGGVTSMESWKEVKDWLEGVVFDDDEISDAVESIMKGETVTEPVPAETVPVVHHHHR